MNGNLFGTVKGLPMALVRLGSASQMSNGLFPLNAPPSAAGLDNNWVPAVALSTTFVSPVLSCILIPHIHNTHHPRCHLICLGVG